MIDLTLAQIAEIVGGRIDGIDDMPISASIERSAIIARTPPNAPAE